MAWVKKSDKGMKKKQIEKLKSWEMKRRRMVMKVVVNVFVKVVVNVVIKMVMSQCCNEDWKLNKDKEYLDSEKVLEMAPGIDLISFWQSDHSEALSETM